MRIAHESLGSSALVTCGPGAGGGSLSKAWVRRTGAGAVPEHDASQRLPWASRCTAVSATGSHIHGCSCQETGARSRSLDPSTSLPPPLRSEIVHSVRDDHVKDPRDQEE